jgi:hypothetical protein
MEKSSTNGTLVARSTGDRTEAQDLCGTNQGSTRSAERSKENRNTKGKAKPDSAARTGPDSELCHAVLGTRTKTEKKIMCNKKIAWRRTHAKAKMKNEKLRMASGETDSDQEPTESEHDLSQPEENKRRSSANQKKNE